VNPALSTTLQWAAVTFAKADDEANSPKTVDIKTKYFINPLPYFWDQIIWSVVFSFFSQAKAQGVIDVTLSRRKIWQKDRISASHARHSVG
jgi:hypothetical protein